MTLRDPRWLGIAIAPVAWVLQEMLSYFFAAQICANTNRTLGPFGPGSARAIVAVITLVTAGAALWAGLHGWRAWRAAQLDLRAAEGWTAPDFLALASVTLSVLLTIGILYGGLPLLFVDACARIR